MVFEDLVAASQVLGRDDHEIGVVSKQLRPKFHVMLIPRRDKVRENLLNRLFVFGAGLRLGGARERPYADKYCDDGSQFRFHFLVFGFVGDVST
jgi:hypothetical protein